MTMKYNMYIIPDTGNVKILSAVKMHEGRARYSNKNKSSFWFSHCFAAEVVNNVHCQAKLSPTLKVDQNPKKKFQIVRVEKIVPEEGC